MPKLLKITFLGLSFLFISFSLSFSQEDITITTYYPSPFGSYRELHLEGQPAVGQNDPGIYFRRTDIAPVGALHWVIREEAPRLLVIRDMMGAGINISLDSINNRVILYNNLTIDENGDLFWNYVAEGLN